MACLMARTALISFVAEAIASAAALGSCRSADGDLNEPATKPTHDGLIQRHRIYWGWFGTAMLMRGAIAKAKRAGISAASMRTN
jgi:hypothetical protein